MGNKKNKKVTGKKAASSASKTLHQSHFFVFYGLMLLSYCQLLLLPNFFRGVQHVDSYLPLISPK
jgi:hypothetical protein